MPTATLKATHCPKCHARTEPVCDIDGETLPECRMCGWRGYKSAKALGIDPQIDGEMKHDMRRGISPNSSGNLTPNTGCREATKFLGKQSYCLLNCPWVECAFVRRPPNPLKARNRQIQTFYLQGKTARELATQFGLSARTIKNIAYQKAHRPI